MHNFKHINSLSKSICISLIFSILILLIKAQYSPILTHKTNWGMNRLIEKQEIDNLFIGSSMFKQGLDVNILDDIYGDQGYYILSYNGNDPVMELFELNYLINNNVSIKNLYVDMYAYSAFNPPKLEDEKIYMELNIKNKLSLWKQTIPYDNAISSFYRAFITANNELIVTWPLFAVIANTQFKNGGSQTVTSSSAKTSLDNSSIPPIASSMDLHQRYAIQQIIELCKMHKINLFFIETPKYISVQNDATYQNAMNQYIKLLKESHVQIITSDTYDFDHSNNAFFIDLIHLSSEGRRNFTNILLPVHKAIL